MRRLLVPFGLATVLTVVVEPWLGFHGHWPVGALAALGVVGGLALAFGAKALGEAGLQRPDAPSPDEDGGP